MRHLFKTLFALPFALCLFVSCKKQHHSDPTPIDSVIYVNYGMLKPGNYWIYQEYQYSPYDTGHLLGPAFDSDYVEKDTIINAQTYHKMVEFSVGVTTITFIRDSLSYLVLPGGGIIFSSTDFTDIFRSFKYINLPAGITDTILVTEQMGAKDSTVTVPAGSFTTSSFERIYHLVPPKKSQYSYRYAAGIGIVEKTAASFSSGLSVEKELVRYHIVL